MILCTKLLTSVYVLFVYFTFISKKRLKKSSFNCQSCHRTKNSHLICSANQLTGFYMMTTLTFILKSFFSQVQRFFKGQKILHIFSLGKHAGTSILSRYLDSEMKLKEWLLKRTSKQETKCKVIQSWY